MNQSCESVWSDSGVWGFFPVPHRTTKELKFICSQSKKCSLPFISLLSHTAIITVSLFLFSDSLVKYVLWTSHSSNPYSFIFSDYYFLLLCLLFTFFMTFLSDLLPFGAMFLSPPPPPVTLFPYTFPSLYIPLPHTSLPLPPSSPPALSTLFIIRSPLLWWCNRQQRPEAHPWRSSEITSLLLSMTSTNRL